MLDYSGVGDDSGCTHMYRGWCWTIVVLGMIVAVHICTGVGVGLGVLGMIVAILVGVVLAVQCRRMKTPLGKEET